MPKITGWVPVLTAALLTAVASTFSPTASAATSADFVSRSYTDALGTTPYRLFVPKTYSAANRYPVILFLHGAGEQGTNNTSQLNNNANGALRFVQGPAGTSDTTYETTYPCFMIAPQTNDGWDNARRRTHLAAILTQLQETYRIDADRIYLTGLSMGGHGSWDQLAQHPTKYAAAIPICGWGSGNESQFKHVPVWVFHSVDDGTVLVGSSDGVVNNLRNNGGNPIYTRYDTGGHSSWVEAYRNPHVVPWLFAQRRNARPALPSTLRIATAVKSTTASFSGWTTPEALISTITWVRTDLGSGTGSSGSPGPVTGIASWEANALPLRSGVNTFRILATGTSYSPLNGGVTTFSDTWTFTHSTPAGDTTAPALAFTAPATGTTHTTATQPLALAGTLADNVAVSAFTWRNERTGQNGNLAIVPNWTTPDIPLLNGANSLVLTARDSAGNSSTRILLVTYTGASPNLAPAVSAGVDTTVTLPATLALSGSVTDDGLPAGSTLLREWTTVSGPAAASFADPFSAITTATFPSPGNYVLRLTGDDGALAASDDVVVQVNATGTTRMLIDFGTASLTTTGNWNNVTGTTAGTTLANLITDAGTASGINLAVTGAFNTSSNAGVTVSPLYPTSACRDYFYTQNATIGRIVISGLRDDRRYRFVYFGSRTDPGDGISRTTLFQAGGTTVALDPINNAATTVGIANLAADATGSIETTVRAQNAGNGYGLLGVLEIHASPAWPPFASWIAGYFPAAAGNPAIVGRDADPDGDGLSNAAEYGLVRRPDSFEPMPAPQWWPHPDTGAEHLALTFRRAVGSGVVVVPEASVDLGAWSSSAEVVTIVGSPPLDSSGLFETVTVRCVVPRSAVPQQFLRLNITVP